jgi:hypothetical protein
MSVMTMFAAKKEIVTQAAIVTDLTKGILTMPVVAKEPLPVPQVQPVSLERELSKLEEEEYLRLSKELGTIAGNAELAWSALDDFLHERGMGYYNFEEVMKFLTKQTPQTPEKLKVSWEPLREKDTWNEWLPMSSSSSWPHPLYAKKVPLQALQLVSDIEKYAPDAYNFYVSDYAVVRPDPFLAVGIKNGHQRRVIFHWDEPAFKMKQG